MPDHYEEVHHPEFVHAPHHVQHGHSHEHVYEEEPYQSDAEHEVYDQSKLYWEEEATSEASYVHHEYSAAHIALVTNGMQSVENCAWHDH